MQQFYKVDIFSPKALNGAKPRYCLHSYGSSYFSVGPMECTPYVGSTIGVSMYCIKYGHNAPW